jgi:mRNA-degrading endonuclease RelE of RelBE toxin-antitoxin system
MVTRRPYGLLYAPEVRQHVAAIETKYHGVIRKAIAEQLGNTPDRQTRNRKPLEYVPGPFGSTWELRCGPDNRFRVFYEVASDTHAVWILAVGVKDRNRLLVGGKEFLT